MSEEMQALATAVFQSVEKFLGDRLSAVDARFTRFEDLLAAIPAPSKGEPGKDADENAIVARVLKLVPTPEPGLKGDPGVVDEEAIVARVLKLMPPPKQGEPGKDADMDAIAAGCRHLVADAVERAIAHIPKAKDGDPGKQGEPGKDADPELLLKALTQANDASALALNATAAYEKAAKSLSEATEAQRVAASVLETAKREFEFVTGQLKALRSAPVAFVVNESGELVGTNLEGESKSLGRVRGADGASVASAELDAAGYLQIKLSDGRAVGIGVVRGKDGEPGARGDPGKDAAMIRPIEIDETRSYPAGTWGTLRGGMVWAERQTEPVNGSASAAGWMVVTNGEAESNFDLADDGRTVICRRSTANGLVIESKRRVPTMIYRGGYEVGHSYERGDCLTRDGSMWVALRDTSEAPARGSLDWRLAVKTLDNRR